MKVLAVVDTGKRVFYSLDEEPEMLYEKQGNLLIGNDTSGIFYDVLIYEGSGPTWKAFGGREFDLPMKDGSTTHCSGQYWSGGTEKAEELLGIQLGGIAAEDISKLVECYGYCSYLVDTEKFLSLIETSNPHFYKGENAYYEYESIIVRQNLISKFAEKHTVSKSEVMAFLKKYGFIEKNGMSCGRCWKERKGLKVYEKIVARYGNEVTMSNNARKMYGIPLSRKGGRIRWKIAKN